jgi:hypothetical protein
VTTEDEGGGPAPGASDSTGRILRRTGMRPSDLLTMPDTWSALLRWLMREGEASLPSIAAGLEWDQPLALSLLERLVDEGYVQRTGEGEDACYRVILARQRAQGTGRGLLRELGDLSGD